MTLYVSIRRKTLIDNKKFGRNDPPFEIRKAKDDQDPEAVHDRTFSGSIRLVYDKDNPLISGAVAWLEVDE